MNQKKLFDTWEMLLPVFIKIIEFIFKYKHHHVFFLNLQLQKNSITTTDLLFCILTLKKWTCRNVNH
jgi:hypothetical protein